MIARFSLYGLLKNQRYFEPFVVLAMLDAGLTFAQIGIVVGLREFVVAALEIPSGAIADVLGRRRSMTFAFAGYLAAYLLLASAASWGDFAIGMAIIGVGDAFRTGTHKAMIFAWLAENDRTDDRVQVYGYTRSWSQIGSAVAIPIAAATVYATEQYAMVFLFSAVPAALNIVNLATYPQSLDGARQSRTLRDVATHLGSTLRSVGRDRVLRRLLLEAAAFGGTYKVLKDYLQPVVAGLAASLVLLADSTQQRATAITAGGVYVVLYVVSAVASRRAHRVVARAGSPAAAAWWLWVGALVLYAGLTPALALGYPAAAVVGFIALAVLHNLFRPILVSRIDGLGERHAGATVLSVESQSTSVAAIVLAPALGWAVDAASAADATLWPVGAVAAAVTALCLATIVRR